MENSKIGNDVLRAAEILSEGGVVAIPTETVYGLAGNALDADVVAKIFSIKQRPFFDPMIVHIGSTEEIHAYAKSVSEKLRIMSSMLMPGPITILLDKKKIIPYIVTAGSERVAIRLPNHPLALNLLQLINFPLAAPSANPFGYISPTRAEHVAQQLGDKVDYILDGGPCEIGIESTIVGEENGEIIVYRKGGVPIERIESLVGPVIVKEHSTSNPTAPGMLKSHYSPGIPLEIVDFNEQILDNNWESCGIIRFKEYLPDVPRSDQKILSESGNFEEAARNLFDYMRWMDAGPYQKILAELLPEKGLGRAINDRLRRASVKEVYS
jgi:L-threonylcarbamoyladenylate synthase